MPGVLPGDGGGYDIRRLIADCDLRCLIERYPWDWAEAWDITGCESGHGTNPAAYDLDAENGGAWQVNRATWSDFFEVKYGWPWERVVMDDETNTAAAWIIYARAGWTWLPWACKRGE